MRYFYEYKIKNGAKVGGYNLEKIIIKDDAIYRIKQDVDMKIQELSTYVYEMPIE